MTTGSPILLHPFDALDDPGAKGLELADGRSIFLVRRDDAVHAYLNRCPHARQRLDSWPDRFLTMAEDHILCGAHAALFRMEDGFCLSGPCAGKALTAVPVEVSEGWVRLRGSR